MVCQYGLATEQKELQKKLIKGNHLQQYKRLYGYAETIRKTNHGSMVKIKCDMVRKDLYESRVYGVEVVGDGGSIPPTIAMFEHMYVRFVAQKQAHFCGMRPLISLDDYHLTTSLGG